MMGKFIVAIFIALFVTTSAIANEPTSSALIQESQQQHALQDISVTDEAGCQEIIGEIPTELSIAQGGCCKVCRKGKACGDSCISRSYNCTRPRGCACDG